MLNKGQRCANKTKCSYLVQVIELHHQALTKVVVVGQTLLLLYWEGAEEMVYRGMVVGQALLLLYWEGVEEMECQGVLVG